MTVEVPKYNELMWPTLIAIKLLGGSGSNAEIVKKVIKIGEYSDEIVSQKHNNGPLSIIEYRLAWARTYLGKYGALENSERGVWSITDIGENMTEGQIDEAVKVVVKNAREEAALKKESKLSQESLELDETVENESDWKGRLLGTIQTDMSPASFEKLAQRILRESGFVEVEVTGKAGDGGIDGFGILKIGLLSFKVLFQCKRYKDSVGPNHIRDFRGAMQGRSDKGLFITTGSFTTSARKEAVRDGAPPIDLVDGDELCEILKRLNLGIKVNLTETVEINTDWFLKI